MRVINSVDHLQISMEQEWQEQRKQFQQLHGPAHQMTHKTRQL